MITLLPVHERFRTFQGECTHMGRPAYFLRTYGCPVKCPWCDSAGTWHHGYIPRTIDKMSTDVIVEEAMEKPLVDFVVITGGEPTIHDLGPLTTALRRAGMPVHLETSGGFLMRGEFDWITLSPKRWKMPMDPNTMQADEFKLIIEKPEDIAYYVEFLQKVFHPSRIPVSVWLHPEWSQKKNTDVLNAISQAVVHPTYDVDFRAGWQLHKLYAVDLGDKRSRMPAPLGGNPDKGF